MNPHSRLALAVAVVAIAFVQSPAMATAMAPRPVEAAAANWALGDLYASEQAWAAAHEKALAEVNALDALKGTLGTGADAMLLALARISDAQKSVARLWVYASLKSDEDVRIAANQERKSLAQAMWTRLGERTSWLAPEIIAIGAASVHAFEQQSPELARRFGFLLDDTLRSAPHTLGAEAEGVLASANDVLRQPENIYRVLANGELPFPTVTLSDGAKVKLDDSAYETYRQSPIREDRRKVFDAFWGMWRNYQGTLGDTLAAQVIGDVFQAKVRHFPDSLAAATFEDNMPESVYRQLVAQADAGLPTMYRYLKLRKKLLGIDGDLAYYDIYPSMFSLDPPPQFSVADAKRIALDVTSVYGPEYTALLKKGFAGQWIDVAPRPGKASGGYMSGAAYDVHPYLLLNHTGDYESLSTFVHEWGHAVHTMLADESQPYDTSQYSTFIAETASIANEMLLNDYMVGHTKTKREKLYYLGQGLELIRATFFRQVMFAEFQLAIHDALEHGQQLSGKRMTDMYCEMLKRYHGDAQGVMKIDPDYCIEWAFIPHFYYGFYVYQYATSMAGAADLTAAIERKDTQARERFIALLKAGGSDYPYQLYRKAGLDMATPEPYQALIARMNRIMDQIDALERTR